MGSRTQSKVRARRDGDVLTVRTSRVQFGLWCFLTFFLTVWTAVCLFIISRYRPDMPLDELIFPIPFLVGWLFVSLAWLHVLFFRDRVRLGPEGLDYRGFLIIPWQRRRLPLDEILSIGTFRQEDNSGGDQPLVSRGVEIRNYGAPLRVGQSLGNDERGEAAELLREHLRHLQVQSGDQAAQRDRRGDEAVSADELFAGTADEVCSATDRSTGTRRRFTGHPLVLDEPPGTFARPSECRYRLKRTFQGVDFVWRGRFTLMGSLVVLCLMLFWNTIVTAFALQLRHGFDVRLVLFLIPFVLVGLAFVAGWLAMLFQPFFHDRWRFTRSQIEHRFTVFWLGPTWRYEVIPLAQLELHRGDPPKIKPGSGGAEADMVESNTAVVPLRGRRGKKRAYKPLPRVAAASPYGGDFRLVFMATDGQPLCDVRHLNEGEARWIADIVRGEFPSWFA